jgi:hypothetical protein
MVAPITHKILALGLAALLLVQYAPVVWLMDSGEHEATCTHCNDSFCVRHAKGHGSHDEHHPMASDHQQRTPQHGTPQDGAMHTHHADGKPQFCTCNHGQPQALSTVVVDKVVLPVPHGVEQPYALQTLLSAPDTLLVAPFASRLFHPPRA